VCWYGVPDDGGECGGVVVRRYMRGGKVSGTMNGCRLCGDSGWMLSGCVVGGYGRCLLSGGESVWGMVVLTFFFAGLVHRGIGILWQLFTLPLLSKISFNFPSQSGILLSCCILACPSRIAAKFRVLPTGMDGPAFGSFAIPTLLQVETILDSVRIAW